METKAAQQRVLRDVLEQRPEVQLGYVFGSFGGEGGPPGPDSDLDVAVAARGPLDAAARLALTDDLAIATGGRWTWSTCTRQGR